MARPLRLEFPGAVWHVTNRGNNRGDIFFSDDDRELFLTLLAEVVRRFHWIVDKYTLMTNHFHLLVETPEAPTLSRGMKWLQQKYVRAINKRHGRCGTLFQGRFKSHLVERGDYLLEVARYIANNPVRAGMVARAEDWKWGSHRAMAGLEPAPPWLSTESLLPHFGPNRKIQLREYRKFVDAGAGIERAPWEEAVAGLFVGSQEWIRSMRELIELKPRSSEHPQPQRYAGRPRPDEVRQVVADVYGTSAEEIANAHGTIERQVVAWLGCYESMSRLGSIATILRLRSTSRVSALIAQCDRELQSDIHLRIAVDRCLDLLRRKLERVPVMHRESYPSVQPARAPF